MTRAMITVAVDDVTIERDPTGKLRVKDDGITAEKIASDAVSAAEIATGAITDPDIADNTVTSGKLAFGTWEKVAEVNVTEAAVTTITVTGLDLDAAKAYMILMETKNPTATSGHVQVFCNGDTTTTNYWTQGVTGYGTTVSAGRMNASYWISSHAGQSIIGHGIMMRPPDGQPRLTGFSNKYGAASLEICMRVVHYTIAGNVTRLDFTHTVAGGLDVGTKVLIFKVSA